VVASEDKNEKNFHYIYVMRKMVDKEKQWCSVISLILLRTNL
jgi:hypothetical protein